MYATILVNTFTMIEKAFCGCQTCSEGLYRLQCTTLDWSVNIGIQVDFAFNVEEGGICLQVETTANYEMPVKFCEFLT